MCIFEFSYSLDGLARVIKQPLSKNGLSSNQCTIMFVRLEVVSLDVGETW